MKRACIRVLVAAGLLVSGSGDLSAAGISAHHASRITNQAPHWSFVAPVRPSLPSVKRARWVRNPIDAFVLARLEKEGIAPSPEADRRTLIRRLYLDLIGLPPSVDQVRAFVAERAPDAYERLVDALIASPHFGERWGRHWLDLARYADSSGYQIDRPRPFAWLFRDWVINAINDDLPFDQFTIEQLAGDLLPNATIDQKTASGFHRLTLMNHEDGTDAEEFRCKARVDRVNTTATVWLGLTVACAECHNHKYDPITQREFYQFYAFFNNSQEVEVPVPAANDPARFAREKKDWDAEQARLKARLRELSRPDAAERSVATTVALRALPLSRSGGEGRGGEAAASSAAAHSAATAAMISSERSILIADLKRQLARHRRAEPKSADARADSFAERTTPARANVHVRGDFLRKGEEVDAGTPAVLPAFKARGANADRLDLARWLVSPENPLTARVAVNQVWQHLFGRGLVNTPEDFGTRGELPSHPELLDWLAVTFSKSPIANRPAEVSLSWSRKALIRLIVTSAAYRQSSRVRSELQDRDPLNTLLGRQNRFRVESELMRDLSLSVGGLLNDDIGGPSFRPFLPDNVKQLGNAGAFSWTDTEGPEKYRRGLYIYSQRTVPYPTSMTFDQADSSQSCTRRERSNTPLQALTLLNHGLFYECAQGLGRRMMELPEIKPRRRIAQAFEWCVARPPTRAELDRLEMLFTAQLAIACSKTNAAAVAQLRTPDSESAGTTSAPDRRIRDSEASAVAEVAASVALSQVLLNLDEFMTRE